MENSDDQKAREIADRYATNGWQAPNLELEVRMTIATARAEGYRQGMKEGGKLGGVTLKTIPAHEYGQHLVVTTEVDGQEVELIRSYGALPGITIHHTCTAHGIADAVEAKAKECE